MLRLILHFHVEKISRFREFWGSFVNINPSVNFSYQQFGQKYPEKWKKMIKITCHSQK